MKRAAIIKGDGIGPEIVDCMLKVLKECNSDIEFIMCEAGTDQWIKNGEKDPTYIPDKTMNILEDVNAFYKGPTGTSSKPNSPRSVAVTLRQKFELYCNIRPIKTYKRLTPNRNLDFVCFREATEGLYTGIEEDHGEYVTAIRKISKHGSSRFAKAAMTYAQKNNYNTFWAITKRNILKKSDGVFWEEIEKEAKNYPNMTLKEIYIDNIMQQLVINPEQFNGSILASTNLFMDIISELAAGVTGSVGLIYSSNMGDKSAMFEAAHGTAPDIVGQGKANPTATILAGAWMADYLGESHIKEAVFSATEQIINEGKYVTADIGGNATTSQMTEVIAKLAKIKLRV